jgi:hypothetical protein
MPAPSPGFGTVRWNVTIPRKGEIRCTVFDPSGRLIWESRAGDLAPGTHPFSWEGTDRVGKPAPSGLYWIRSSWSRREAVRRVLRLGAIGE